MSLSKVSLQHSWSCIRYCKMQEFLPGAFSRLNKPQLSQPLSIGFFAFYLWIWRRNSVGDNHVSVSIDLCLHLNFSYISYWFKAINLQKSEPFMARLCGALWASRLSCVSVVSSINNKSIFVIHWRKSFCSGLGRLTGFYRHYWNLYFLSVLYVTHWKYESTWMEAAAHRCWRR